MHENIWKTLHHSKKIQVDNIFNVSSTSNHLVTKFDGKVEFDGIRSVSIVDNNNKRAVLWIKPDEDPHMHFKYFAATRLFKIYFVNDKWIKGKRELSRGSYNVLRFNRDNKKLLKIYFNKYDKKNAYTEWQC